MAALDIGNISPQDALKALQRRMQKPSPSFSWWDVYQQEHSDMFTVAKTAGFDVLDDLAKAVEDAIAKGETFDQFQKDLIPILQAKGWWGQAPAFDPVTGETSIAQLGSLRRLQIIYDTNLRMSYAAGRWASIDRNRDDLPYLMYLHGASRHPRPQHLAWDHICLPIDDPFWDTHYPPNGWNCSCTAVPISEQQFDHFSSVGSITTVAPALDLVSKLNARTGEIIQVPNGIDPGFGYNVGKAFLAALQGG